MFKALLIALLAAPGAMAAEPAADRLMPLLPRGADPAVPCTSDGRWCVQLGEPAGDEPPVPVVTPGRPARRPLAEAPSPDQEHAVWPSLIVLRDGSFLAGVETRSSTSYSGGGGSSTELRLFHVPARGAAARKPVFTAPTGGSLMIRACFGERDMRQRRGACHDEYGFSARIGMVPAGGAARPVITYATEAWRYPRGVSRSGDATQMRPLRPADLVRQRDATCSYARRFAFDAAAGEYRPDRPLPDCSDYTVP